MFNTIRVGAAIAALVACCSDDATRDQCRRRATGMESDCADTRAQRHSGPGAG